jgi:hypothetical protein
VTRKRKRKPAICPFCNKHRVLTDEDVTPVWVNTELRRVRGYTKVAGLSLHVLEDVIISQQPSKPGTVAAHKMRVCGECNHRFGDMENTVSRVLKPTLSGSPIALSTRDVAAVAEWGTLKAICYDHFGEAHPVALKEDLRAFRRDPRPAPFFGMWLGRYAVRRLAHDPLGPEDVARDRRAPHHARLTHVQLTLS